jgi:hypothetical protein
MELGVTLTKTYEVECVNTLKVYLRLITCFCSLFVLRCFKTYEISHKSPIITSLS